MSTETKRKTKEGIDAMKSTQEEFAQRTKLSLALKRGMRRETRDKRQETRDERQETRDKRQGKMLANKRHEA